MNYKHAIRYTVSAAAILGAVSFSAMTGNAQEKPEAKAPAKKSKSVNSGDPFRRYQPVIKPSRATAGKLDPPPILERIEKYRAQKMAAAAAHVAAPKPTTALLLSEVQVTGIFRTPRGWSAMVEATPLSPKLTYVVDPGENFFDGQLVAIEESRLVFRRDVLWTDGRREKVAEIKPLRVPSPMEAMTTAKAPAEAAVSEAAKVSSEKSEKPDKQ
jgi:hypothetical protein